MVGVWCKSDKLNPGKGSGLGGRVLSYIFKYYYFLKLKFGPKHDYCARIRGDLT